jgi:hypothetical protein
VQSEADVQTIVRDTVKGKVWDQFWKVDHRSSKGELQLSARTHEYWKLFGYRMTKESREFRLILPSDRNVRGAERGFEYQVIWLKKANGTI